MTPRNWDANGWCVDCLPTPFSPARLACAAPACRFVASAVLLDDAERALFEHHVAIHLPNAEYVLHTQRQS